MLFAYQPGLHIDLNLYPNKDAVIFPEPVTGPGGVASYAMLHRPMWDQTMSGLDAAATRLPAGLADDRPGIWISYVPADHVEADIRALALWGHRCVALPEHPYESAKIGAGPPPIRVPEGWLLIHHGVQGDVAPGFDPSQQGSLVYRAGAMLLDPADPSASARTAQPLLEPETVDERVGTVPNVVFPTAMATIEGRDFVFYGMADSSIGASLLERTRPSTRDGAPHRLGLLGCGAFGTFLADAIAELPSAELAAVADTKPDLAVRLAAAPRRPRSRPTSTGCSPITTSTSSSSPHPRGRTPPSPYRRSEPGGTCSSRSRSPSTSTAATASPRPPTETGRVVTVDHLLRFAPLVTALAQLLAVEVAGQRVLGPIRRFAFENDATDEDLPPDHWFWDPRRSGGIFVEHGVHFFDLAANLIGSPVEAIQAMAGTSADGRTDTVCATARYHSGATASFYHSFTHSRRGERQSLRLDLGNGECRLDGWIPLEMQLEAWTDRAGMEALRAAAIDTSESACPNVRSRSPRSQLPNTQRARRAGQPTRAHPTRHGDARQAGRLRHLYPAPPR